MQLDLAQSDDSYGVGNALPREPDAFVATDLMIEEETVAIKELENKKEELEMKLKSLDRQLTSTYRGD